MKGFSYEAETHIAMRGTDGQIVHVRRGDSFPEPVDQELADELVAAGVATRYEVI